jgi:hypothetical protein
METSQLKRLKELTPNIATTISSLFTNKWHSEFDFETLAEPFQPDQKLKIHSCSFQRLEVHVKKQQGKHR